MRRDRPVDLTVTNGGSGDIRPTELSPARWRVRSRAPRRARVYINIAISIKLIAAAVVGPVSTIGPFHIKAAVTLSDHSTRAYCSDERTPQLPAHYLRASLSGVLLPYSGPHDNFSSGSSGRFVGALCATLTFRL